jgi:NADH dehydrogenase
VKVTPELTLPGRTDVFVIGDMAAVEGVPGVAPAAMQMGRHTARNIARALRGELPLPFATATRNPRDDRSVGGRCRAPVREPLRLDRLGRLAALHIYFLIGFRSRLVVLVNWAWAYVTFQRGGRLITGEPRKS